MTGKKILTDPFILMCAQRYALGRATYAVGWVADELIAHKGALRAQWRQQIVRDIREAVGADRAGMDMDQRRWLDVVAVFHAMPGACRGCALSEEVCRQFRPLCCDRCDHGPGEPPTGGGADVSSGDRCGTYAGAQVHRRRDEKLCDSCREAQRAYLADWRAKNQPRRPRQLIPCGSVAAYKRHLRNSDAPCAACRRAQADAVADFRRAVA